MQFLQIDTTDFSIWNNRQKYCPFQANTEEHTFNISERDEKTVQWILWQWYYQVSILNPYKDRNLNKVCYSLTF